MLLRINVYTLKEVYNTKATTPPFKLNNYFFFVLLDAAFPFVLTFLHAFLSFLMGVHLQIRNVMAHYSVVFKELINFNLDGNIFYV